MTLAARPYLDRYLRLSFLSFCFAVLVHPMGAQPTPARSGSTEEEVRLLREEVMALRAELNSLKEELHSRSDQSVRATNTIVTKPPVADSGPTAAASATSVENGAGQSNASGTAA